MFFMSNLSQILTRSLINIIKHNIWSVPKIKFEFFSGLKSLMKHPRSVKCLKTVNPIYPIIFGNKDTAKSANIENGRLPDMSDGAGPSIFSVRQPVSTLSTGSPFPIDPFYRIYSLISPQFQPCCIYYRFFNCIIGKSNKGRSRTVPLSRTRPLSHVNITFFEFNSKFLVA